MPSFVISYDLRKQRNYQPLWGQLNQWGCVRVLESLWLGDLKGPASAIRDLLTPLVDSDDGLLVLELKPQFDWASLRSLQAGTTWLKTHSP